MAGALHGICDKCENQGRCGIVCMNSEGVQLIPLIGSVASKGLPASRRGLLRGGASR
jgi:hypothetical protein